MIKQIANIRRSHSMYLHFQMLATSKLTHCLCSFVKLLNCCKLVCNSTLWSITQIKMCLVISQMSTNNVVNLLVASIWKCKYIEWDRLIFAICFIIVDMITWFHTIYRINCTIIWFPKWCKQIFCLNKSNNYWSILPLIDVLLIYY